MEVLAISVKHFECCFMQLCQMCRCSEAGLLLTLSYYQIKLNTVCVNISDKTNDSLEVSFKPLQIVFNFNKQKHGNKAPVAFSCSSKRDAFIE